MHVYTSRSVRLCGRACVYVCVCMCVWAVCEREKEKEGERERERERERENLVHPSIGEQQCWVIMWNSG